MPTRLEYSHLATRDSLTDTCDYVMPDNLLIPSETSRRVYSVSRPWYVQGGTKALITRSDTGEPGRLGARADLSRHAAESRAKRVDRRRPTFPTNLKAIPPRATTLAKQPARRTFSALAPALGAREANTISPRGTKPSRSPMQSLPLESCRRMLKPARRRHFPRDLPPVCFIRRSVRLERSATVWPTSPSYPNSRRVGAAPSANPAALESFAAQTRPTRSAHSVAPR